MFTVATLHTGETLSGYNREPERGWNCQVRKFARYWCRSYRSPFGNGRL